MPRPRPSPENDPRIATETVDIRGASGTLTGYLARPKADGKLPAVIVIHENRGLNPHIKDVARRVALEGFLALAPDFLSPHRRHARRRGQGARHDRHAEAGRRSPTAKAAVAYPASADRTATARSARSASAGAAARSTSWPSADPDLAAGVAYYGMQPKAERRADDQGAAAAALCRARRAHQCRHPGLQGGAEGGRQDLPDLHL